MVIILNYLPWIIIALGVAILYKVLRKPAGPKRNNMAAFIVAFTIASFLLLQGLTAGYIPKKRSSETKIAAPAFETAEATMQDKLRSPALTADAREAKFKEQTDWRKHKRDEIEKVKDAEKAKATEATQ